MKEVPIGPDDFACRVREGPLGEVGNANLFDHEGARESGELTKVQFTKKKVGLVDVVAGIQVW